MSSSARTAATRSTSSRPAATTAGPTTATDGTTTPRRWAIPTTPGIEPALLVWIPGITPSGLLFYTGDKFPAWKGNLMVGSIVRGRTNGASGVERVVFNDKMWETRRETFLAELKQRIRDVRQGPDGLIYLLTEEVDGAVLKLEPAD